MESQTNTVEVDSLTTQQLGAVKRQLDGELEQLTSSFSKLRGAQTKFGDCANNVRAEAWKTDKEIPILVPLTSSLYVPGLLVAKGSVLVDVGTGFFVEKSIEDALDFYNRRFEDLGQSLGKLEEIIQGSSKNLRIVENVLRQRVTGQSQDKPAIAQR